MDPASDENRKREGEARGSRLKCFHNGIILIVNCFQCLTKVSHRFDKSNNIPKFTSVIDFYLSCALIWLNVYIALLD